MECIICYEENQPPITFSCQHTICINCYQKLLNYRNYQCPICREPYEHSQRLIEQNAIEIESVFIPETRSNEYLYKQICIILSMSIFGFVVYSFYPK